MAQDEQPDSAGAEPGPEAGSSGAKPRGRRHRLLSKIPEVDRIPMGQKIAFAVGQNTEWLANTLVTSTLWMPFFNIGMEISPIVLGVILMIMRTWDAISDPLVGNLSDNVRTPWGRRRPLIILGALATAATYPFIWNFPESVMNGTSWLVQVANHLPFISQELGNRDKATFVYLTSIGLLYFTCFTCWSMPYYGLQLELTPNYDERTRLTVVMAFVGKITAFFSGWAFVAIVFVGTLAKGDLSVLANKPEWLQSVSRSLQPWLTGLAGEHASEKPIVLGMQLMSWVFAVTIIVMACMPALFVKERYYEREAKKQARDPFWKSMKESARCGPLWSLISVSFFLVMGYSSTGGLGTYVNIYYVCGGDMILAGVIAGMKGSVLAITGISLLPFYTWLGEKYDKRKAVMIMLVTAIVGHLLNYYLLTPKFPYLQIVSGFFESVAISAVWLFLPSMKADVADWDEVKTARRREGSINAFYSWFIKVSLTLSMGIGGAVLAMSGYDATLPKQTDGAVHRMFIMYVIIPSTVWALALISAWFYPISRDTARTIRTDLEARRGYI